MSAWIGEPDYEAAMVAYAGDLYMANLPSGAPAFLKEIVDAALAGMEQIELTEETRECDDLEYGGVNWLDGPPERRLVSEWKADDYEAIDLEYWANHPAGVGPPSESVRSALDGLLLLHKKDTE